MYRVANNYIRYILLTKIALYKEQVNSVIYLCKYFSSAVKVNFTEDCKVLQRERRPTWSIQYYSESTICSRFVWISTLPLLDVAAASRSGLITVFYDFSVTKKWKMTGARLCNNYQMWIAQTNRYKCVCSSTNSEMYVPHVARIGLEMSSECRIWHLIDNINNDKLLQLIQRNAEALNDMFMRHITDRFCFFIIMRSINNYNYSNFPPFRSLFYLLFSISLPLIYTHGFIIKIYSPSVQNYNDFLRNSSITVDIPTI